MESGSLYALLAVLGVSAASLVGALTLMMPGMRSHRFLLALVALAAGTLVGDAILHLLPEGVEAWDDDVGAMTPYILLGFVALFVLEVVLRGRHAHLEHPGFGSEGEPHGHSHGHSHPASRPHAATHPPAAGKDPRAPTITGAEAIPTPQDQKTLAPAVAIAPYAITNLVGDALHNLLDGVAIAAAFLVDTAAGVATTIAVVLHEIPQELADFGVLLRAGMSRTKALAFNLLSALFAVAGAVIVLVLPVEPEVLQQYGFPIIMGAFLYVGAADLIPELHHHSKGRDAVLILACFLVGLGIMFGILGLEGSGILGHGHE